MESIQFYPIGKIFTPFTSIENMPIQPIAADGCKGYVELLPKFEDGLKDLDGFSHITLIYHFHKITNYELMTTPFMDKNPHGIFATKAPKRPNAIGISTVKLIKIEKNIIHIEQVDMLNETPLLDIKPFIPKFDNRTHAEDGWMKQYNNLPENLLKSDDRFK
ncbi:tRNA (N6-threonylcarbamoyladenosine(37)-N6)-methyltransferase TrmO [Natronoflexus pectinivorans]|uniref:tRNA-Thr(GGU) m(6)t(6)A37 methyltransferase TsaA n=1 Tax=Natronoflexus pectinivorans TaxID=682526 RepID=A0A4R2GG29_9BACT|nr:tRNA (N6-threonylcarbamoyladenosine(37)-N6)-methyltransferase TrmO [Natronoflexus pectinivorans]TCO07141.1 tRNA-Thr(GGU) m(6)t(6)A37 methyltransferase TsaA [Natronoflexus pectinivorans]